MSHRPAARARLLLALLAGALLVAWAALTVIGVEPWDNEGPRDALIAVLVLAGGSCAAWALRSGRDDTGADAALRAARADAEAAREDAAEQARAAEEQAAGHEEQAHALERRLERALNDARGHRQGALRAIAALNRERHWSRELRGQVVALHRSHGSLAGRDDVRTLVLKVALELTEAPKGLLLARADRDGDGKLDVVAAEGFDGDPTRSELAQRFAERVIERDSVIREDAPGGSGAAVDDEIKSLIAVPIWMADEFSGVVICADRAGGFADCDDEVLLSLGDHAGSVMENAELHGRLRESLEATVRLLAEAAQAKDPFLRGRSEGVAEYVEAVSAQIMTSPRERELLTFAALLHDVGKVGISERILLKPGDLTPEERSVVELHTRIGSRLVEQVPGMEEVAPLILHHHERWDGTGYPERLGGDEIPLAARLIGVADAFTAMTEQRPYRERMTPEEACRELERCAGSQFDARVVELFTAEVRARPRPRERGPLAAALADRELEARRSAEEGTLGAGTAALTDSLTLLPSHRAFHEAAAAAADRAAREATPFAVVLAELSGLPAVNAAAGYAGGDDVLRESARVASQLAVRHGALAARVGGHRLGLLVAGVDEVAAGALAEQLRLVLAPVCEARAAAAAWAPGEAGEAVIARAQAALAAA